MDKAMSAALMADFSTEQIGHKPATWCKTCAAAVRNRTGKSCGDHRVIKCPKCKTNITEAHTCLDFVGHADVRARLCEADPEWTWEPFDFPGAGSIILSDGQPVGLWITLTVGGVAKPGYGSVDKGKPEAMKELIGDCLLRGTPIQTVRGIVRIEDVRIGDLVPTRAGWRRVTDHWLSHPQAPTRAVLLADGRLIVGTPHHRVPTANRGMQCIEALRNGDMLYAWPDTARTQAQTRSSGTGAATGGSRIIPTGIAAFTSWRPPHRAITCTSTSTRQRTGQFPKAGTSITATLTRLTTIPETSSPSPRRTTPSGTASIWSPTSGTATNAASLTRPCDRGAAGAPMHARSAVGAGTGLLTSAPAGDLSRTPASARSAELGSPPRSRGSASALVPVVTVLDAGPGEVWNLSVEGVHEYVANGLIVSNSIRNAGLSFGIAWKLWAKGERSSGEGEGGQSGASGDAWDTATPAPPHGANGNGTQRGQVSRPARPQAPETAAAETDEAAQEYANQAHEARTLGDLESIQKRARQAGKLTAIISDPATGKTGKLAFYIDARRKAVTEADKAMAELNQAGQSAGLDTFQIDAHVATVTGADMESATPAQLRQAARALRDKAAA